MEEQAQPEAPILENTQPSDSQPEAPTVESLSGHEDGTVLPNGEVVVGDTDEDGNVVGWHKEAEGTV